MAFLVKNRIAPPGTHVAELVGVEEVVGQYGKPALRWVFAVRGPDHAGQELVKVTGDQARLGTSLGDFLAQLYGRELRTGEAVDPLRDLVGQRFQVFAVPGANGDGAVIQTVKPLPSA